MIAVLLLLASWAVAPGAQPAYRPAPAAVPIVRAVDAAAMVRTPAGADLLDAARTDLLRFRLGAATRTLDRLAAAEPGSPAPAYLRAKVALWEAMIAEQPAAYRAFFTESDRLMAAVKAQPAGPTRTYLRAEAELQRALVHVKAGEYARGALALRQAYNHAEHNVRKHPGFEETYKVMGLCHVAVGAVPGSYRWLLRLAGFSGTVAQGLRELERAASRARYEGEEAAVMYAFTDQLLNESRGRGLETVQALHRRYPDSPVMAYLAGFSLIGARRAGEAERVLARAQTLSERAGTTFLPYPLYFRGLALFRLERYADAERLMLRYAERQRGQAHVAQAVLHAGLAREMQGDRPAAEALYRRVNAKQDFDSDASAVRQARALLRRPMTPTERTLLRGANAFDSGRYDEAVALLQPVLGDAERPAVERAEAAYRSGRALQASGRPADALRHFRLAASNPGDRTAKWGPWSLYYAGEVLESQGKRAEAGRTYRSARDWPGDFDYRKSLEQRVGAALSRL